jgi:hypothetical protein
MLGSDLAGELAIDARDYPPWSKGGFGFLPDTLSDEISQLSNKAMAKSVETFRATLGTLMFHKALDRAGINALSEYLSWEELIHTCYFDVPRFAKLVAYAVSRAEGFRATKKFKSDHDYPLVENWFDMIRMIQNKDTPALADVGLGRPFGDLKPLG